MGFDAQHCELLQFHFTPVPQQVELQLQKQKAPPSGRISITQELKTAFKTQTLVIYSPSQNHEQSGNFHIPD